MSENNVQKGQSLVELALTISILMILLAGAFDIGNAFLDYIAIRDAAQEGAMYASVAPLKTDETVARVQQSSTKPIDLMSDLNSVNCSSDPNKPGYVCVTYPDGLQCTGQTVQVDVYYNYQVIMPLYSTVFGISTIPLHASVSNVILAELCP